MKALILLLACCSLKSMDLVKAEEGRVYSPHSTIDIHVHADIDIEQLHDVLQIYLPGANGNVSKHVTPRLHSLIRQNSNLNQERQTLPPGELQRLISQSIDEALAQKDKDLADKDIRIARINRNKKIALALVTACTAITTCFITAVFTLVPAETVCNT